VSNPGHKAPHVCAALGKALAGITERSEGYERGSRGIEGNDREGARNAAPPKVLRDDAPTKFWISGANPDRELLVILGTIVAIWVNHTILRLS
jgi:hypothetical protein